MTFAIALSVLVMIVGLGLYYRAANPKTQEVGKLAFFAGLFVSLLRLGGGLVATLFK